MTGRLPLAGIRVVEFSHMVMGPAAGLVLADLGAEVIKVEPLGEGDKTRLLPGTGAGYFPMFNRNKRSLAVDLKTDRGREVVRRLASTADVFTENFRPGGLEKLGLGSDALRTTNPGLIYCSMKGFLAGPYEKRAALDEIVQMMGGLAYMTGPPGEPLRAGTSVNDIMGGLFAAIGILAALHERESTGQGKLVRSSLFENNVFLVGQHIAQFGVTGTPALPMPVRSSSWAIYNLFDTADGDQVFLGVVSDTQWPAFCRTFGLERMELDPDFGSNALRVTNRQRLLPQVRRRLLELGAAEICALAERAGLPFAPVNRPEDLLEDPHLAHEGAMIDVTLPGGRVIPLPALPLEMGGERLKLRLDLPRPGEHSEELVRELGYSEEEAGALFGDGILSASRAPTVVAGSA